MFNLVTTKYINHCDDIIIKYYSVLRLYNCKLTLQDYIIKVLKYHNIN